MSEHQPPDSAIAERVIRSRIVGHGSAPAGELLAHPANFRTHPQEQREALRGSLNALGWLKDVLVNRTTGRIIDGHARVEEAAARSPLEPVPVTYLELSEEEERLALAVLDPISEMAGRDDDALSRLLDGMLRTEEAGLDALLASMAEDVGLTPPKDTSGENAEADGPLEHVVPPEPITRPGDIIRLGWHVLMCGDSMDDEHVDRLIAASTQPDHPFKPVDLVLTDPPYAVYGSSTGIAADITDDKMVRPMFRTTLRQIARVLKPFGHFYVCCDWRSWASWWEVAKGTPARWKNCIVWDKGGAGLGSNYANTHEFIGFGSVIPMRENMTQKITGIRSVFDSNIWKADRVRTTTEESREHNAQKPTTLLTRAIENSTAKGETVLDLFGGSGSTLIACEQTERVCLTMEMEPGWCDVIVNRWERATGLTAQRPAREEVTP